MKRTLRKRAGLWELSVPLRAPVRGIWRYGTFAEAWVHLWRTGYPPGLPSEIRMAARGADPSSPGSEDLTDADEAALPQLTRAEASKVKPGPPEPDVVSKPVRSTESDPVRAAALPANESKSAPHGSRRISRAIAVGLASGLTIFLVILFWPLSHRGSSVRPSVTDSTVPNAAPPAPKAVEAPVPPPASGAGKSHASIQANGPSWITACVDGKVVFSKLFTQVA